MARGTRKMYDFLRLSSAVIEYDTTISYFCSCYIHTHHKFASALFLIHLLSGTKEASTIWGILISWLTGKCRRQSHMILAIQESLKSLLQNHSLKASILWCSALFMFQHSHWYMTTGKAIALTIWTQHSKSTILQ